MHFRADYLLQVLEKIGAPLMASILNVNARSNAGEPAQLYNEAQKIAELLSKTVQTSIDMSHSLDLGPTGEMTDSIRIALTGLAGPLVAGAFENHMRAPGDAEIKRIVTALQAVLTFAENFEANSENADRLKNIEAEGNRADTPQYYVQYIHAFIPVINAVSAFSFGQPEQKLVMDISSRLAARAEMTRQSLLGDIGPDNKRAELGILKALAEIYAACHATESARIQTMNDDQRAQLQTPNGISQAQLWDNYEARLAMLESLAQALVTGKTGGVAGSRGPQPVQQQIPQAPVAPPIQQPIPQQPAAANPMAMFASPQTPPQSAPPPVNVPPPQQQAAGQNIPPVPPTSTPPAAPQAVNPGNPMSFFKTPPKEGT